MFLIVIVSINVRFLLKQAILGPRSLLFDLLPVVMVAWGIYV